MRASACQIQLLVICKKVIESSMYLDVEDRKLSELGDACFDGQLEDEEIFICVGLLFVLLL